MKALNYSGILVIAMFLFSCSNANKDAKNDSDVSESSYVVSTSEEQSSEKSSSSELSSESLEENTTCESTVGSSESGKTKTSDAASSDTDWDEMLDAYEELVDAYLKFLQKYQKGDLAAMSDYMQAMEKAQTYSEKLSQAQSMMTSSQIKRYMTITTKMADALASFGM